MIQSALSGHADRGLAEKYLQFQCDCVQETKNGVAISGDLLSTPNGHVLSERVVVVGIC